MRSRTSGGVAELVKTLVYAVVIAVFIRTFFYEPFNIPSASMEPTLLIGDYLFVSKFSYGYSRYSLPLGPPVMSGRIFYRQPQRGDVVVFKFPKDPSLDYIKRVIGLPGDRIQMKNGVLYINGTMTKREPTDRCDMPPDATNGVVRQPYWETLPNGVGHCILKRDDSGTQNNTDVFLVPSDSYFMMGDNRDNSSDSRVPQAEGGVGYVPAENLVGRAEFIFFSTNGYASWWELWKWPFTIRYGRLLTAIH
jgi:signal peptidase I